MYAFDPAKHSDLRKGQAAAEAGNGGGGEDTGARITNPGDGGNEAGLVDVGRSARK